MKKIRIDVKENVEKYIDKVFKSIEQLYDEKMINPLYFLDVIYLSSIVLFLYNEENKTKRSGLHVNAEKWDEIGYKLCYEMKRYIENDHPHKDRIGMISGFGYCCFAVEQYSEASGRLKNFSASLHKLFLEETFERSSLYKLKYDRTNSNDFDSISGVSGWLYYLLDYDKCDDKQLYEKSMNAMIDYLIGLTNTHDYKGKKAYNFHIPREELFLDTEKERNPNGIYNFGMSHGIIAPMLALSKAYTKGFRSGDVKQSVDIIYKLYKDFESNTEDSVYWPAQLSYDDYLKNTVTDTKNFASSWCYGNCGVLMGLIMTAENMGWKEEKKALQSKLEKVLNRGIEDYYLVSPALCHGFSGVLATRLFNKRNLMNVTDVPDSESRTETEYLEEAVQKIIGVSEQNTVLAIRNPEEIENEYGRLEGFIGDYSFLNGVTGIVAVFCELLYEFDDYRKILLIS